STPSDNLREQVRKIYSQREFKNLTEENDDSEKMEEKNEQGSTSVKDLDDFLSMKISIRQAVEQSNNEIGIGIDILNLILSCRPGFNPDNPLPINPGLIQHTCHAYSPPTKPFEVQNLKLMLGMKRKQIKNSAELLLNAAKKLNDIVKKEESFWSEALSLRERYWSMCRGGKEKNAGHQIFVNYGYSDATATCLAQILRSPEERKIVVSLPKRSKRAVKLKLQQ
ncbi:18127_t:CDS:2, partial [Acaulospora morrowiae]